MWVHMGLREAIACCPFAFGFFELSTPESCPWVHLLVHRNFPEHFCGSRCQAHCCGFGVDCYTASMPERGSQPGGRWWECPDAAGTNDHRRGWGVFKEQESIPSQFWEQSLKSRCHRESEIQVSRGLTSSGGSRGGSFLSLRLLVAPGGPRRPQAFLVYGNMFPPTSASIVTGPLPVHLNLSLLF